MGKQKRPRRRNKGNNNSSKKAPPSSSNNDANKKQEDSSAAAAVSTTPVALSALLGKIRHANGQTRLAALSALQQNVMLGQNSNNSSASTSTLWQAVREQVLDPDLAIATTATTCLTEFIAATSTECSSSSSTHHHHPMTAGWFLVLIGRLQECHKQLHEQQQPASTLGGGISNKNNNKQQQWLALSLQCMHAICALLETNPLVMQRLERTASLRNDSLETLWQWLDTASTSSSIIQQQASLPKTDTVNTSCTATTTTPMDTAATTNTASSATIHHHHGFDYWNEIQEQTCRALHSMTEDNWSTLLLPWLLQEPKEEPIDGEKQVAVQQRVFTEIGPRILRLPQQVPAQVTSGAADAAAAAAFSSATQMSDDDSSLNVTCLHMAGIYLSCHFGAASCSKHTGTPAAATIIARVEHEMPTVLEVLKHGLVWNSNSRSDLIENLCRAHVKYTQQTLDDVLERDILRRQDAKKESARSIARRLQAVKQQKQQQQQQQQQQQGQAAARNIDGDEHNDDDDDDDDEDGKRGKLVQDRTDARQVWQEAMAQWYTSIQALELSLEIFANLTLSMSTRDDDNRNGGDDEIMHVDDMDDDDIDDNDADMMHSFSNSIVGKLLLQPDADGLINRLVTVLQQLCQTSATLCQQAGGDAVPAVGKSETGDDDAAMLMDVSSSSSSPPTIVAESLGDLQSKAAAGIGHCLLAFPALSCWSDVEQPRALATISNDDGDGSSVTVSSSAFSLWTFLKQCLEQASTAMGRQGIASTMVVALQSRPMLRKQMQALDLNLFMSLLSTTTTATTTTSVPDKPDESSSLSSYHLVRDAVFMLGLLCSQEETPVEVKEKVCRALLQTISSSCNTTSASNGNNVNASTKSHSNINNIEGSIVVVTEILNVLMDMYGSDDDAHAMIFNSLDVLGHFQRTLPLLKQQISVYSSTNCGGGGEEDADLLEGWKETAMNASRFIQYKKGH